MSRALPLECFDSHLELGDDFNQLGDDFADYNQHRRGDFGEFLLGDLFTTTAEGAVETFLCVLFGHGAEH